MTFIGSDLPYPPLSYSVALAISLRPYCLGRGSPITLWMFSTLSYLLVYFLTVPYYFVTMPVGFIFKLIYGLKPQVSGIKVSTDDPFSKLAHSHFLIGIAQTSTWWLLKLTDCGKKKAIFGVPSVLITWRCHSMISTIVIYGNGYSTRKKSMFLLAILGVYPALKWKNPKDDYAYSVN